MVWSTRLIRYLVLSALWANRVKVGGGDAGDIFAFSVVFDPETPPVNHAIFGPEATPTGQMVVGEVTITVPRR